MYKIKNIKGLLLQWYLGVTYRLPACYLVVTRMLPRYYLVVTSFWYQSGNNRVTSREQRVNNEQITTLYINNIFKTFRLGITNRR